MNTYTQEQVIAALRRLKAGEKLKDVCKDTGIYEDTLRGWAKKAHIVLPRRTVFDWDEVRAALG